MVTYRGVQVHEDGAGNIFAVAGLGEEGLERATLVDFFRSLGIKVAVGLETVFEEIPGMIRGGSMV